MQSGLQLRNHLAPRGQYSKLSKRLSGSTGHIQLQLPGQSQLNRSRYEVYALSDSIVPAGNLCQRRSVLQGTGSMAMVNRHLATAIYGVAHSDVGYIYVL